MLAHAYEFIQDVYTVLAHAFKYNQAQVPIFGTWFPFRHSYLIERLDDQDYEPRISTNRFSPPGCV